MALWSTQTNVSNISSMIDYVNYATGNAFGIVILIAIFFIAFLTLKLYPTDKAFAAASWISLLCAFLMYIPGWIGSKTLFFFVALTAIAIVYTLLENKE